ncbi:MAG: hypothetical protein KDD61_10045 [Bdellovibrionales bacterium]|nr:hypothetical protein [Bdellovibrionales bacterium]
MFSLLKILPMSVFVGAGVTSSPKLKAKINKVMNITKVASVQMELNSISKMIYLDSLDGSHPREDQFSDYVRRNMQVQKGQTRDVASDMFGVPYRYTLRNKSFTITSAGLDGRFNTEDDLHAGFEI